MLYPVLWTTTVDTARCFPFSPPGACLYFLPAMLFTDYFPTRGSGQDPFEISRVGSGGCQNSHGPGRVTLALLPGPT